ncbi:hypothetical protein ACFLWY_04470 [Chloroflexota bacterium]
MQNELYLLIGALIGFLYTLAAVMIVISLDYRKTTAPTTLGNLRSLISKIQEEIQQAQEQIWSYGSTEEEKARDWRIACTTMAGKAVSVLQSCWLEREQNATALAVYDELLTGLKSVGVGEIRPALGQEVEENDRQYRVKKMEGKPPYRVSKLLCPGYYFKPASDKISGDPTNFLLEPALIEVSGIIQTGTDMPDKRIAPQ